jgi:hypothetical protein
MQTLLTRMAGTGHGWDNAKDVPRQHLWPHSQPLQLCDKKRKRLL